MPSILHGSIVALVTPFTKENQIDEKRLKDLVNWHISQGTNAIVPCGTTGESATLSHEEHHRAIEIVISEVKKRIPVIAGAGSNNTAEAYSLTEHAKKAGAEAVLSIAPYYNKPTQKGYIEHYKALNEIGIPIVVYNVPGRTGSNIEAKTTLELAKLPNIIGIKEASGNIAQIMEILKEKPDNFAVVAGDDSLAFPLIMLGASGCISVVANQVPKEFSQLISLAIEGYWQEAKKLHYHLLPLMNINFIESNPIPVKTSLALMRKIELKFRSPLCEMSPENLVKLKKVLEIYKLIKP